ncbi:MAG: deoxynucleoside kinase [Nitrospirae bacterium]|nr:deoxynucleoside kinase [Nitrospirota bacterium]MBI3594858.1 deoxynucleoside kinase [Nitrospirota bacterium]
MKEATKDHRYIAIEGPIGVGKTTLAQMLAKELKGRAILEKVDENPFLAKFYHQPEHYAFQTQLFFLFSRYRQQQELFQLDLFSKSTVLDYLFARDQIFASINLNDEEFVLYQQIQQLLQGQIPKPDLVIYLQAEPKTLFQRIKKRGREFEKEIEEDYLNLLIENYNQFFFNYGDSPLLIIQTNDIDFVQSRPEMEDLIKQIRQMKVGMQYYNPMKIK